MAKQEARLNDINRRPLIAIGTPKRLLEIVEKDPLIVHRTRRIIIDEVDKTLLPLKRRSSIKKMTMRENHPRPAKLLVEKIKRHSRVITKLLQFELSLLISFASKKATILKIFLYCKQYGCLKALLVFNKMLFLTFRLRDVVDYLKSLLPQRYLSINY